MLAISSVVVNEICDFDEVKALVELIAFVKAGV